MPASGRLRKPQAPLIPPVKRRFIVEGEASSRLAARRSYDQATVLSRRGRFSGGMRQIRRRRLPTPAGACSGMARQLIHAENAVAPSAVLQPRAFDSGWRWVGAIGFVRGTRSRRWCAADTSWSPAQIASLAASGPSKAMFRYGRVRTPAVGQTEQSDVGGMGRSRSSKALVRRRPPRRRRSLGADLVAAFRQRQLSYLRLSGLRRTWQRSGHRSSQSQPCDVRGCPRGESPACLRIPASHDANCALAALSSGVKTLSVRLERWAGLPGHLH